MLCNTCASRNSCATICNKCENYIDQDYVELKETPLANIEFAKHGDLSEWANNLVPNVHLTPTEKQILTLIGLGLTRDEVAQVLDITLLNVRVHLHNVKKKQEKS